MAVRMAKISEKELKNCVKYKLWGSNHPLDKWQFGDMLILYADKKLAAVAEVIDNAFADLTPVWGNGLFPYRIPVKFNYYLEGDKMIPFNDEITGILRKEWGYCYGWAIIAKRPMSKEASEKLIKIIAEKADKQPC